MECEIEADWIGNGVDADFLESDAWMILHNFFVLHSPCKGQSAQGIAIQDYGWSKKVWGSEYELKWSLDYLFDMLGECCFLLRKSNELEAAATSLGLVGPDWTKCIQTRAVFTKSAMGSEALYMSLFYHLRNAFSHGRFSVYGLDGYNYLAFEDGRVKDGGFIVTARGVLRIEDLLEVVSIIEAGPNGQNTLDGRIINEIRNGYCRRKEVQAHIPVSDSLWEGSMKRLKTKGLVKRECGRWVYCESCE